MAVSAPTSVSSSAASHREAARKRRRREAIEGYLFLLPNFLGFLIFFAGPLVLSIYYAFTDWDLLTPPQFVGLQNFVEALGFKFYPEAFQAAMAKGAGFFQALSKFVVANDPLFWTSVGNTFVYAIGVLLLAIVPAFLLAYLLNSKLRGMPFFRAVYYLPVVASVVAISLVYMWIFYRVGMVNFILGQGIKLINSVAGTALGPPLISWLNDPKYAMFTLIIMTSWATIGYDMVIFLAALQSVPHSLVEAATVDGAGRGLILRKIIVPLITPTIFFILVTNLIAVLQIFAEPYIMTNGGPANSTLTIVLYLYQMGFQRFQMGYASALAWIAFGIIFVITTIQFRVSSRWVVED